MCGGCRRFWFCIVFSAEGEVLFKGDPKDADFATVFDAKPAAVDDLAASVASKLSTATVDSPASVQSSRTAAVAPQIGGGVVLGFGNDDEDF